MRVALVLDNTGSMADDGKMAAMQTAAKSLVDQLSPLAKTDGDVYISIVPFAKDVNVGASNYNKYWVDFTDWDAARGTRSANHNRWTGCVVDRDQDYDTKNTTPTSGNAGTQFPADVLLLRHRQFILSAANHAAELRLEFTQEPDRRHEAHR